MKREEPQMLNGKGLTPKMARLTRLERVTSGFVDRRSIQLSYKRAAHSLKWFAVESQE